MTKRLKNKPRDVQDIDEAAYEEMLFSVGDDPTVVLKRAIGLLELEPIESCVTHPGEAELAAFLAEQPLLAGDLLEDAILSARYVGLRADLLRMLGRIETPLTEPWRADLIAKALRHDDLSLRDAAVRSAESWGGKKVVGVLRKHDEPVEWLRDYLARVIDDLQRS